VGTIETLNLNTKNSSQINLQFIIQLTTSHCQKDGRTISTLYNWIFGNAYDDDKFHSLTIMVSRA
jgi:hypothetical protein